MKNFLAIFTVFLFLSGTAQAQVCGRGSNGIPRIGPPVTYRSVNPQVTRQATNVCPNRTASGVPIRHVNVPVPNYGYGYGGYGYGYGAYGWGYSGTAAPINQQGARPRTGRVQRTRKAKKEYAAPNPQTARNYQLRKALNKYSRENSVGGRLFLKSQKGNWLLAFDGQPRFEGYTAYIPCSAKNPSGFEEKVTLTLEFDGDRVVRSALRKDR